jgi:transposase
MCSRPLKTKPDHTTCPTATQYFQENLILKSELKDLRKQLAYLEEQKTLRELKKKRSSEKQLKTTPLEGEITLETKRVRQEQPGHGPALQPNMEIIDETITTPKPTQEVVCTHCHQVPHHLTEKKQTLIDTIPEKIVKRVITTQLYHCDCGQTTCSTPSPYLQLIPNGLYTANFAITTALSKYQEHIPLERQAKILKQSGIYIQASTLYDQVAALAPYLMPTYWAIEKAIKAQGWMHCDETLWSLFSNGYEVSKQAQNKYASVMGLFNEAGIFYYALPKKRNEEMTHLLDGFKGLLISDGHNAYKNYHKQNPETTELALCFAHWRRYFWEADLPKLNPKVQLILGAIQEMYRLDKMILGEDEDARLEMRQTYFIQQFEVIEDTLKTFEKDVSPALQKALTYTTNNLPYFKTVLNNAKAPLDNNLAERAVRPLVIGRKNHQGSRSIDGQRVSMVLYSIIETAALFEISPFDYILAIVQGHIERLGVIPTSVKIQEEGYVLLPQEYKQSLNPDLVGV